MPIKNKMNSGVTLVELLVVLGIVAALSGLVASAVQGVRERSRQTGCTSNLRQIGAAMLLYAQDYEETFPPMAAEGANREWLVWPQLLSAQTKSKEIFQCPSAPAANEIYPGFLVSYAYNVRIGSEIASRSGTARNNRESSIIFPARTVLITDSGTAPKTGVAAAQWPVKEVIPIELDQANVREVLDLRATPGAPHARHHGRANVLWADGHVQALAMERFYAGPDQRASRVGELGASPCLDPVTGCGQQ